MPKLPDFRAQQRPLWLSAGFILVAFILIGILIHQSQPTHELKPSHPHPVANKQVSPQHRHVKKVTKAQQLKQTWAKTATTANRPVNIALYDPQTKQTISYTNQAHHQFKMASAVKVGILMALMHQTNGKLTAQEKQWATTMIVNSNNPATLALYNRPALGGASGLQQAFQQLGMHHSVAKTKFGTSITTAKDQIKLLKHLYYPSKYLDATSQAYLQRLMSQVEADQRWGISAGASQYTVKNGWLYLDQKSGWIINSLGQVQLSTGRKYLLVVLTDHNPSQASGQQLIEKLAQQTATIMK